MKLFQLPIKIALILTWFSIATIPVRSQTGNMSDITLPNPGEITPDTPDDVTTPIEPVADGEAGTPTEPVADGEAGTPTEPVADGEAEVPTEPVADGEAEVPTEPVADGEAEVPTEPVADGEAGTPTEPVAEGEAGTPTEPVAEGEAEVPTEPVADGEAEVPSEEITVEEDVETPSETPMEEAIVDEGEIPSEEITVEEDVETPSEDAIADDNDVETPLNSTANDNDAAERNAANENVMEAIASNNDTTEPEVVTNEDNLGVTLGENAAGDVSAIVEDAIVPELATETPIINSETQTPTEVETDNSLNLDSDTPSQPVIEETKTNIESIEVAEETATINSSSESGSFVSEETNTESIEVAEETATIDSSSESESVVSEETNTENIEVAEETETVIKDKVTEELAEEVEESTVTATEETEEEVEISEETTETEEEVAETEETEEEVAESNDGSQDLGQEVDRIAYEVQVQESPTDIAIQMQEEFQLTQLMDTSGLQLYGQVPSAKEISSRLAELGQQTGQNPAFINISLQSDRLEAFVVLPDRAKLANGDSSLVASTDLDKLDSPKTSQAITLRETIKDTSRQDIIATATQFREEVSDSSKLSQSSYLNSSQELYKVLIEPIEAELEANDIDVLVFSMDSGLRLLPLAALHDGKQFLIEKYAVAIVPSFGLTDTRYVSLDQSSILAMGASEFIEQAALPTMPIELETIVSKPRQGEIFINEQFTVDNFKAQNSRETPFPIVHLGTHAEFKAGSLNDSYIQFYDGKLKIPQLQDLSNELGWNSDATPIELLVLSACETALGDEQAELGFAGLAVQAGVKSALASLWYVSDVGTLALMGEFYDRLGDTLVKAEALRQTQLEMLQGNVKVDNKQVNLSNGQNLDLPAQFPNGTLTLDHPYFWSAFTLIGNWN